MCVVLSIPLNTGWRVIGLHWNLFKVPRTKTKLISYSNFFFKIESRQMKNLSHNCSYWNGSNTKIICKNIIFNDYLAPTHIWLKKYIIISTTHLSDTAGLYNQVHTDTGSRWPDLHRYRRSDRGHWHIRLRLKKTNNKWYSGQPSKAEHVSSCNSSIV